jgi:hypothetical protein
MGISTPDAKKMSVWELAAVTERWVEAHDTGQRDGKLSKDEADEIWTWMQSQPAGPLTLAEARKAKGNGAGSGPTQASPGR